LVTIVNIVSLINAVFLVNIKGSCMKKSGLGSIPKSLSWIDTEIETDAQIKPVQKEIAAEEKGKKEPAPKNENVLKSTQRGLSTGWTRATFIVDQEINEKIKALAYWERLTVKEVVHEALTLYLAGKNVKAVPKREHLT
jgi:hypothetical protein